MLSGAVQPPRQHRAPPDTSRLPLPVFAQRPLHLLTFILCPRSVILQASDVPSSLKALLTSLAEEPFLPLNISGSLLTTHRPYNSLPCTSDHTPTLLESSLPQQVPAQRVLSERVQ